MKRQIAKYPSKTTSGHLMQAKAWVAETVMVRKHGQKLGPYFWRQTAWKWLFANELKAAAKFIKQHDENTVIGVVVANKNLTTLSSYGDMEILLQKKAESLCRLLAPKDTSPPIKEQKTTMIDLRTEKPIYKKTLFERMTEIENGF